MYLIHLPVVVWLQVAIAELLLHWSLKLAFISTMAIAVSLLTYDLFVRSTFIGWLLNGRLRDRVLVTWVLGSARCLWRGKTVFVAERVRSLQVAAGAPAGFKGEGQNEAPLSKL